MKKLQVIQPVVFHLHNIMDTVYLEQEILTDEIGILHSLISFAFIFLLYIISFLQLHL